MTTEAHNTAERNAIKGLRKDLQRRINRQEGIIKSRMEELMANFNTNFEWEAEELYKAKILLDFYKGLQNQFAPDSTTEAEIREFLRHTIEHTADDILFGEPYRTGSNAAANIAHQWEYETKKRIYGIASGILATFHEE